MSKLSDEFIALIAVIIMTVTFFSPVIISALTGNWWYMFLFSISWIPALVELTIADIILKQ